MAAASDLAGVDVYNNYPDPGYYPCLDKDGKPATCWKCPEENSFEGSDVGCRWQCVELAQRYYRKKFNYQRPNGSALWGVRYAWEMFDKVTQGSMDSIFQNQPKLHSYPNDRKALPPEPVVGDLLVFYPEDLQHGTGHVAVLTKVDKAHKEVWISEQNYDRTLLGVRILTLNSDNTITTDCSVDCLNVKGLIRSDGNPNVPTPPQQNENYIVSDTRTQWNNNDTWGNAVEVWVNPAWTSLTGATWIWKSYKVTTEEAANGVTAEFKRLFTLSADTLGKITVYADNGVEVFLNGTQVAKLLCMARDSSSIRQECVVSYPLQGKSGINELRFVAYSLNSAEGATPENNSAGLAFKAEF